MLLPRATPLSIAVHFLCILALAQGLLTGPSPEASAACQNISQGSAETQIYPQALADPDYLTAKNHYWDAANADLTPACVVFPTSAEQVSYVVSVLLSFPTVPFAVKSGGHNTNVGFSSVDFGVLISFSQLNSTILSSDQATAEVGSGARWENAISALEPYNLAVVGGRIGDVGVGGLLLGGGLSFLSAQYGLGCDNVVNYEVVLANSTIVNANEHRNTDLFWALKGGGNQFGIVTKFTLKTYPIGTDGQVWAGTRIYDATKLSAVLNATQHFIEYNDDPKAAVIVTLDIAVDTLVQVAVVFFFYDGETPQGGVFDEFNALIPTSDQVTTQTYSDFESGNDEYSLYGLRYLYRTTTIPNLPGINGTDLYNTVYSKFVDYVITNDLLFPGFVFSLAYQPLQTLLSAASVASGGDAIQLDPRNGDRVWIDLVISWETAVGDDIAASAAEQITSDIDSYVRTTYAGVPNTRYVEGNLTYEEYNPLFLNDAMYDQKPAQSYGNNSYERLRAIQKNVDPNGFFPTRTGGFKYT
ncbi:putative FAD-linked oxidoreductase [Lachnellula hyalina]|uniref:Putative FAD-linked oxidoreductase n=1 Tax=Lachnellula hyalina TaxID=1316788 RepID=A0A8H8R8D7_9HELO|nr:putative FAD-linked oxidoreductase [Lachnellula hyalina]TVY29461.1 putative FAD-linked oxidoreductase [Lachnellula hyalina]